MAVTTIDILKNRLWLTVPPLVFSLTLMGMVPTALTTAQFNYAIPDVVVNGEILGRIIVFGMPAFFSIGLATRTQQWGLAMYLAGIALYYLSYGTQNYFPDSAWINSMGGFAASAYTNAFWMVGLGMLGEKFYFSTRLRYRPILYIAPVVFFVTLHVTHAVIYFQQSM